MLRRVFKKKPKIIEKSTDKVKTAVVHATGPVTRTQKSPDEVMGRFFDDVQRQQVYPDGKTFVDMVPRKRAKALAKVDDMRHSFVVRALKHPAAS